MSSPVFTPQSVIDDIYFILDALDREMTSMGLPYCAMDGTLLGAVRHGGMIPWDDDADLFILADDMLRLDRLAERLRPYGIAMTGWWWGAKAFLLRGTPQNDAPPFPSVDLFPIEAQANRLILAPPEARQRWPQEYLDQGEWELRARKPFGPLSLWMPSDKDAHAILDRLYGTRWNDTVFQVWDHVADRPLLKQETALPTRKPALPKSGILPARHIDQR